MTSFCLMTQMPSSCLATESKQEKIKEHLIDCKFHQGLILQRSTYHSPSPNRKVYESLKSYQQNSWRKNLPRALECFILCQNICPVLTSFLCISLGYCWRQGTRWVCLL